MLCGLVELELLELWGVVLLDAFGLLELELPGELEELELL